MLIIFCSHFPYTDQTISLWGRSEIIKMNLLPRLTFLMSSIPLKFPRSWWQNPMFVAGGETLKDRSWQRHNLNQMGQIIDKGKIITFNNLKKTVRVDRF